MVVVNVVTVVVVADKFAVVVVGAVIMMLRLVWLLVIDVLVTSVILSVAVGVAVLAVVTVDFGRIDADADAGGGLVKKLLRMFIGRLVVGTCFVVCWVGCRLTLGGGWSLVVFRWAAPHGWCD